jgi:Phasin protein
MEDFAKAQTELLNTLQEANRQWLNRMQSEVKLASEFASKVGGAHSIPDAMAAYQEWSSRRFEMMVDDGKQVLTQSQKAMETAARLLSNGWFANGQGGMST